MKKIKLLIPALLLAGACASAGIPFEQRPLACVMPFTYSASDPQYASSVAGLQDSLTASLMKTARIRLVERARVEAAMKELQLAASGAVDSATAAKVGKQLGARFAVLGSVTALSVNDEWRSVKIAEKTDRKVEVSVEARLVNLETGELLGAGRAVGKAKSSEKHAFGGKIGKLAPAEAIIQKAIMDLTDELAKDLVENIGK
ncbi:MAG: CsgG/HfaB family protein [Elusimicrobiales bacterium]|jgi:curli biogenesis system outer membrane secretion channel CsgG